MATNPLPPHRDLPTLADQKKNKKPASPLVPLGILVAAIILIALIVYLPKTPRRPNAPSNATVPAQPTGTQVQLSNVRLSAGPVGDQLYIYARVSNAGQHPINGLRMNVTFPGQNQQPVDTVTSDAESYDNGNAQPLSAVPIKPGTSRDIRIPVEHVPAGWNHQLPELSVQDVTGFGNK